jgi:hypothetical protein
MITGLWIYPIIFNLGDFAFHPNAKYSDILISHWPYMSFLRDAWRTWGEFPLWNPLILSGAPVLADPLFGIWYPPNWLALVLPIEKAFNLLFWLHLVWAGWGMYRWMRSEGLSEGGAIIAGLAFSGLPKLIGHIGLGHLGLVSAVAWTPWSLLSTRRLVLALSTPLKERLRRASLGGALLSLVFLADPRWLVPACVLMLVYGIRMIVFQGGERKIFTIRSIASLLVLLLAFAGVAAGLALPLIEFTSRSTRMDLSAEEVARLSMPLKNLFGVFVPGYDNWPETLSFVGLIVIGLVLIAILTKAKGWIFWSCIALGGIVLSLGDQTPLYNLLLSIVPGLRFLRAPARFYFISSFAFAALAGMGMDGLTVAEISERHRRSIRLGLVGFCGFLFLIAIVSWMMLDSVTDEAKYALLHMVIGSVFIVGLSFLALNRRMPVKAQVILWSVALVFDLLLVNKGLIEIRSKESVFTEGADSLSVIEKKDGWARLFSPSYSVPQHVAAVAGVQLADGVNPLQLKSYWQYMAGAISFSPVGYSVTLPPFVDGDPTVANYQDIDASALGLLNVVYVVSGYPLDEIGLELMQDVDGVYVYQNAFVRPRAWIEYAGAGDASEWRDVESIDWSPNSIVIEAEGEGRLVLSEVDYPGWEASINGEKVSIEPYKEILRSVILKPGDNLIEFHYHPMSVYLGFGVTVFTVLVLIYLWLRK